MSMNIFNCITGEAVVVNDTNDSRTVKQTCFSRRCRNGCLTHCETRVVSDDADSTGFATPTCLAVNQSDSDNRCCCNRNRCCCNRCCRFW